MTSDHPAHFRVAFLRMFFLATAAILTHYPARAVLGPRAHAPLFEATAVVGTEFEDISLQSYLDENKWVVLFFYRTLRRRKNEICATRDRFLRTSPWTTRPSHDYAHTLATPYSLRLYLCLSNGDFELFRKDRRVQSKKYREYVLTFSSLSPQRPHLSNATPLTFPNNLLALSSLQSSASLATLTTSIARGFKHRDPRAVLETP